MDTKSHEAREIKIVKFIMVTILLAAIFFMGKGYINKQKLSKHRENIQVAFDATKYINYTNGKASLCSPIDVEKAMGEPESKEDWTYKGSKGNFLLTTYAYDGGKYEFTFYLIDLVRITINDNFTFSDKDDIPYMFGLKKYKNTYSKDTGYAIRFSNTGIKDLWVSGIEGNSFDMAKITYASGIFD